MVNLDDLPYTLEAEYLTQEHPTPLKTLENTFFIHICVGFVMC